MQAPYFTHSVYRFRPAGRKTIDKRRKVPCCRRRKETLRYALSHREAQRKNQMATYQILYWHNIPVQVRAKDAGGRAGAELPARFQEAIDQAAMAAGMIGSDDYTEAF